MLALSPPAGIAAPGTIAMAAVAGAAVATAPSAAVARSRIRSSGGYFRPSIRTPSIGVPSSSGGYSRSFGGFSRTPSIGAPSAGDRAISGRSGAEALQGYRARRQTAPSTAAPSGPTGFGSYGGGYSGTPAWAVNRGWSVPAYAYRAPPSFGIWNGLFLWFLLDTLSRPGHAAFFYNHQNDPGYQSWHADAERAAESDPQLKAKLDALDQKLAAQQGQPLDPNYLPPGTDPEMALASDAQRGGSGGPSAAAIPLVLGAGGLFLLWTWRRRHAERRAAPAGGSSTMALGPMKSAVDMLRHKLSGEGYKPSLFRVGMTLTMDPTPFILATGATKVPIPKFSGNNLLASVEAVGTLRDGAVLHRLYLDEKSFFQIHLDAGGAPDECRFFGLVDEVVPASEDDWAFWLDPQEGMIGWPEFQTKDGKTYERAWAPGPSRATPRAFTEEREELGGRKTAKLEAMLYAAPTGAAAPAPQTEYVLVALVEAGGEARIAIHAGIDINPAALSLA